LGRAGRPDADPVPTHVDGGTGCDEHRDRESRVAPPSPRALAGFLDERLELCDPLVERALVGIGSARWRDDGQGLTS
jgi:hypothetical protein